MNVYAYQQKLDMLSEQQKNALMLYYFHNYTYKQVAEKLGTTTDKAREFTGGALRVMFRPIYDKIKSPNQGRKKKQDTLKLLKRFKAGLLRVPVIMINENSSLDDAIWNLHMKVSIRTLTALQHNLGLDATVGDLLHTDISTIKRWKNCGPKSQKEIQRIIKRLKAEIK